MFPEFVVGYFLSTGTFGGQISGTNGLCCRFAGANSPLGRPSPPIASARTTATRNTITKLWLLSAKS